MERDMKTRSAWMYLGIFLVSVAVLTSEILLMRIVSLVFFIVVVYVVIGIAMVGFSAAGTLLALFPSSLTEGPEGRVASLALAFSVLTPLTYYLAVTPAPLAVGKIPFLLYLIWISLVMTVHFFLAGLVLSFLFTKRIGDIHRLYFVNLLGSGIGCFTVINLIRYLGGEGLILLVGALGALAAACFGAGYRRKNTAVAGIAVCLLLVAAMPKAREIFPIRPTLYGKQLAMFFKHRPETKLEYQAWDPIARVDVVSVEGEYLYMPEKLPFKFATNDGSAGTFLVGFERDFPDVDFTDQGTLGLPYWLKDRPEVLIIGLGGALDVAAALHYRAQKVYGIEISRRMIEVVKDQFRDFVHAPYEHPNVSIIHDEGRSYVRRMSRPVDLIVMTGVDTVAAQAGGTFVMAENYLYTVEAFQEYFEHLREDGILCITRFIINPVYPEKALRLCATGVEALRRLGVDHPERNFLVVSHGIFLTTLMKKTAYTPTEIETFLAKLRQHGLEKPTQFMRFLEGIVNVREHEGRRLLYRPGDFADNAFGRYFQSVSAGTEESYIAAYPWNMRPCTDNKPFYFVCERPDNLVRGGSVLKEFPPLGFVFQLLQLAWFSGLTIALVLLPLYVFKRKGLKARGGKRWIAYFCCLGMGFMFVEIGFMQKFTLFLGHPTYSVSVVLFALLVFSGLGSLVGGRILAGSPRPVVALSILTVSAVAALYGSVLDPLFARYLTLPLGLRILISIGLVAPLAFFMGMPFPAGLRRIEQEALGFVPWAWGINGSASVVGIVLCGLVAVFAGFTAVIFGAIAVYLAALVCMVTIPGGQNGAQ